MNKGKFVDIYVLLACASHKKPVSRTQGVDELINKACKNLSLEKEEATKAADKKLATA